MLMELQEKMLDFSRQLSNTKAQLQSRAFEQRRAELTARELHALSASSRTYRSVGRMFLEEPAAVLLSNLESRQKQIEQEMSALKGAETYLEQKVEEAVQTLRREATPGRLV
jgi:prefoldin subunit 1